MSNLVIPGAPITIRRADPCTDVRGIANVVNSYEPAPIEVGVVRQWFDHNPEGRVAHRTVAMDEAGNVLGYGAVVHEAWWPAYEFYAWVGVLPPARGRGVGRRLAEDAQAFWEGHEARRLTSEVRDDDPVAQRFARKNGFQVTSHVFASSVNTETFVEKPFQEVFTRLREGGIRLCSVADFGDGLEARRALHELNTVTTRDIPGHEGHDMPFDEFEKWVCGSDWYRPDGQLLAVDGDKWVGLCAVQLLPESGGAYNMMTGVVREYRRRGIALALKIMAIRYARVHGARGLHTSNASQNAPMLAVNRRLGYQPHTGKYLLTRSIASEEPRSGEREAGSVHQGARPEDRERRDHGQRDDHGVHPHSRLPDRTRQCRTGGCERCPARDAGGPHALG